MQSKYNKLHNAKELYLCHTCGKKEMMLMFDLFGGKGPKKVNCSQCKSSIIVAEGLIACLDH